MINIFALALLSSNNQIVLLRRAKAGFGQGLYSLVGGKVEHGETARQAIKREIEEEVGLEIPESALELVHTLHRKGTESEFVALCFKADISQMAQPINKEPDKHDDLHFFNSNALPDNILPAHKQIIEAVQHKLSYSEHGW